MSLKMKFCSLKNIAIKIYDYFCKEAKRGKLFHSLENPENRTRHILDLSKRSFNRWIQACDCQCSKYTKSLGRAKMLDNFDRELIRKEICTMLNMNETVTLRKLKVSLKKNNSIEMSKSTLWRNVRAAGFTFRKYSNGRKFICEKPHIVAMRSKYLREVKEVRKQGYDIVYLDETWINAHHTNQREWQSSDGKIKRLIPSSKGQRLIIAHAGSRQQGLIQNAELVFLSKSIDNRDYHSEMNGHIFRH